MSQLDLGAASSVAALGLDVIARRAQRAARAHAVARQRRVEAIARAARHDAYKARVRFVPSDQVGGAEPYAQSTESDIRFDITDSVIV